jgi:hypothetical protein
MTRHSVDFAQKHFNGKEVDVVEIGVYKGENALNILQKLNVRTLYLIDPFELYDDKSSAMGKSKDFPNVELEAKERLKDFADKIVWIKKYSDDALEDIPLVDFAYIDGNHEYSFVKRDMSNYYKKIKKDGVLAGHDIQYKEGVKQAFNEFMFEHEATGNSHVSKTDWWILL